MVIRGEELKIKCFCIFNSFTVSLLNLCIIVNKYAECRGMYASLSGNVCVIIGECMCHYRGMYASLSGNVCVIIVYDP